MNLVDRIDSVYEDAKTMDTRQLAKKYGVSLDHMYRTKRKYKIISLRTYPGKQWNKDDYRILHLCVGKISTKSIAKLLSRTTVAVESKCQSIGIVYGVYGSRR